MADRPIGVFDSGMGGISVLRDLKRALPSESYIYYGDNKNAPYGVRSKDDIERLAFAVARKLIDRDIKALVIACNTASSAAEDSLREELSIPVIGIEPELVRAKRAAGDKKVLVFATAATLKQKRYLVSLSRNCPGAISIPSPELVLMVERGVTEGEEPEAYFREKLKGIPLDSIGAIVLGCTHFSFLKPAVAKVAPGIPMFDGNQRVIEALMKALLESGELKTDGEGSIELLSSSEDPAVSELMYKLLKL